MRGMSISGRPHDGGGRASGRTLGLQRPASCEGSWAGRRPRSALVPTGYWDRSPVGTRDAASPELSAAWRGGGAPWRASGWVVLATALLLPALAAAQPVEPAAQPETITAKLDRHIDLHGYFRTRFDVMDNFDLNHGTTPTTGQPLFPLPTSGEGGPLTSANMRMRLEPVVRVGWGVTIQARIDFLDNIVLGSTPESLPASVQAPMSGGATRMVPPQAGRNGEVDSVRVKRAWGDVALPFGVLSVGRMGALIDWGTGFFINSGNCIDCDQGDVGDRVSFATPLFNHILGFAFDFGASGPTSATLRADPQPYDLDRRDDVRSYALLFARYDTPEVIERYRRAGRTVLQYGLVASLRTQEYDVPIYYLTGEADREYDADDVVRRGLLAFGGDAWFGLRRGGFSVDLEAALVVSRVKNASLLPGVDTRNEVSARQWGGVGRAEYRWPRVRLNLELGVASGDSAPGFGVRPPLYQVSSQPGDLDGPQIRLPGDTTVDNFRFNPDYHVDLILWRRIIGTVTDAFYARPSVSWEPLHDLWLDGALISSTALEASSTPSGERPLGVELDLGARYRLELGFEARLTYGVLFPLSGFRNNQLGLDPEPAHTLHVVLAYIIP